MEPAALTLATLLWIFCLALAAMLFILMFLDRFFGISEHDVYEFFANQYRAVVRLIKGNKRVQREAELLLIEHNQLTNRPPDLEHVIGSKQEILKSKFEEYQMTADENASRLELAERTGWKIPTVEQEAEGKQGGWAPGTYMCKCMTCGSQHIAAKLSFRCYEHRFLGGDTVAEKTE